MNLKIKSFILVIFWQICMMSLFSKAVSNKYLKCFVKILRFRADFRIFNILYSHSIAQPCIVQKTWCLYRIFLLMQELYIIA